MQFRSPAFENNSPIPKKYTADAQDFSPPLEIKDIPKNAKSLALIVDDPDAPMGTFVHWVIWNIPPNIDNIPENYSLPTEGVNGFGTHGWNGPSPPAGKKHRYFFKLYALDKTLKIPNGSNKEQLETAMEGHILSRSEWVGTYQR